MEGVRVATDKERGPNVVSERRGRKTLERQVDKVVFYVWS